MIWGEFDIADHHFTAALPGSDTDDQVWTIVVTKLGEEVRRETIPLNYRPTYGPDVSDVDALNERIEEIVKELGLE